MKLISGRQRESFYAAALVGLQALESRERSPRRFGADADARWEGFSGHLDQADRIDLLVRDVAVTWPAAFSPAVVFQLPYLADDEPFGPDWRGLTLDQARRLWSSVSPPVELSTVARVLGLRELVVPCPDLEPATRLVVAGASAVLNVGRQFEIRTELSWPDQVLVIAEKPENRQLAGLVAPIIGAKAPTKLTAPAEDVAAALKATGFMAGGVAVVSEEAGTESRIFAEIAERGG